MSQNADERHKQHLPIIMRAKRSAKRSKRWRKHRKQQDWFWSKPDNQTKYGTYTRD